MYKMFAIALAVMVCYLLWCGKNGSVKKSLDKLMISIPVEFFVGINMIVFGFYNRSNRLPLIVGLLFTVPFVIHLRCLLSKFKKIRRRNNMKLIRKELDRIQGNSEILKHLTPIAQEKLLSLSKEDVSVNLFKYLIDFRRAAEAYNNIEFTTQTDVTILNARIFILESELQMVGT